MYFYASLLTSFFASSALSLQLPQDHVLWGREGTPTSLVRRQASPTASAQSIAPLAAHGSCSNAPFSRGCWGSGFSVSTDFDTKWPDTGVTRHYNLEVTNTTCNLDGTGDRVCLLLNGQYPGPTIFADWGDTISVTLKNSMQANGTGLHWHGLRQLHTTTEDGANGLTECPLAPGDVGDLNPIMDSRLIG
jgi:hypothetical protein